jgi:hypothetical protein
MSQTFQTIKQTKELSEEEMTKLVNEIVINPEKYPMEAKLILVLDTWNRQGPAYTDFAKYEVLDGEVEEVELSHKCESYPYPCYSKVAIIPKSVPVVIKWYSYTDTTDPPIEQLRMYVFTGKEWKRVDVT